MSTQRPTDRTARPSRAAALMPTRITAWVRVMAWASMVTNGALILTGGLVRLTGSGLGCPTWPRCTADSWTNTPEMGVHGVIEFGNRLLTFVLAAIAILTFMSLWNLRRRHPGAFRISLLLGLGIPLQAVIGGVTVRTGLNPWVVGIHFIVSAVLVALAAVLVNRLRRASLSSVAADEDSALLPETSRSWARGLAWVFAVSGALAVYLGTLVTGTGPHSGDSRDVARHAFDAYTMVRLHVVPTYVLVVAVVLGLVVAMRQRWPAALTRMLGLMALVLVFQAAVGYYQWFNALPVVAVALHLFGSATLVGVLSMSVEKLVTMSRPVAPTTTDDVLTDRHPVAPHQG